MRRGLRATRRLKVWSAVLLLLMWGARPARAYSVFTHQQIIDLAWESSIRPALLARFPHATPDQLAAAKSFAYGGSAIQDAGYYPFGHEFFSDLTHYVRTGDFITALLRDSQTVNEYAFAIGALSHYVGDNIGHQDAVNPSTAVEFPKLERRYGPVVTYDESPRGHVRTEFAFDIDALSKHRFAPAAYLRMVGLQVPRVLLERAFAETYGLTLHEVLGEERPALRSYRSSVRSLLPHVAVAEVIIHRNGFPNDLPSPGFTEYEQLVQKVDAQDGWEQLRHKHPTFLNELLSVVVRIIPKVGALSDLSIRGPQQLTESWYVNSVNLTVATYNSMLRQMTNHADRELALPDRDLDTGYAVEPGAYRLTDDTYAKLLHQLTSRKGRAVPLHLRENILNFYSDLNAPIATKRNPHAWERVLRDLTLLRNMPTQA